MASVDLILDKCAHCDTRNSLKHCSRCKCISYCSRQCQRADAKNHTPHCKSVGRLNTKLLMPCEQYTSYSVHALLTRALIAIATETSTVRAWRQVLKNQVDHLRMDIIDSQGIRDSIPFTILHLGRDDKAVSLAKHILRPMVPLNAIADVPVVQDIRFDDIITDLDLDMDDIPFAILVLLLVVKLRIFAALEARRQKFNALMKSSSMKLLRRHEKIVLKLKHHIIGDDTIIGNRTARQNVLTDQLLKQIGKRNLQALVNNESLELIPEYASRIFEDSRCFFHSTPGALDRVQNWIETHEY